MYGMYVSVTKSHTCRYNNTCNSIIQYQIIVIRAYFLKKKKRKSKKENYKGPSKVFIVNAVNIFNSYKLYLDRFSRLIYYDIVLHCIMLYYITLVFNNLLQCK
jgi:hypothetical protein